MILKFKVFFFVSRDANAVSIPPIFVASEGLSFLVFHNRNQMFVNIVHASLVKIVNKIIRLFGRHALRPFLLDSGLTGPWLKDVVARRSSTTPFRDLSVVWCRLTDIHRLRMIDSSTLSFLPYSFVFRAWFSLAGLVFACSIKRI